MGPRSFIWRVGSPPMTFRGNWTGFLPWRGGTIGADGTLSTSGTGTALLANMRAQGSFEGRNIESKDIVLAGPEVYDSVSGTFEWNFPRLRLPQLVMKSGADIFQGSGEMGDGGQLSVRVSDGTKRTQVAVQ